MAGLAQAPPAMLHPLGQAAAQHARRPPALPVAGRRCCTLQASLPPDCQHPLAMLQALPLLALLLPLRLPRLLLALQLLLLGLPLPPQLALLRGLQQG